MASVPQWIWNSWYHSLESLYVLHSYLLPEPYCPAFLISRLQSWKKVTFCILSPYPKMWILTLFTVQFPQLFGTVCCTYFMILSWLFSTLNSDTHWNSFSMKFTKGNSWKCCFFFFFYYQVKLVHGVLFAFSYVYISDLFKAVIYSGSFIVFFPLAAAVICKGW